MVRTTQKRKRTNGPFTSRFKRRRFIGRRRRRYSRSTTGFTSRSLNLSNGFKRQGRLMRRNAYRRMLWRSTQMMQHFQSIFTASLPSLVTTPTGVHQLNYAATSAMDEALATSFWKSAGGCQDPGFGRTTDWMAPPGAGIAEPLNIVIRGGRVFITMANPSTTDTINVRVQLVFPKQQVKNTTDTAVSNTFQDYMTAIVAGNPRPISWSAQSAPDYSEYLHKPLLDKTIDLKPGDDMMVIYKLKTKKIDVSAFERGVGGMYPYWLVYACQRVDTTAGAQAVNVTIGHNLSFCVTDTTAL